MLAGILLLLVLSGTFLVVRTGARGAPTNRTPERGRFELWMGALMLLLAAFPLLSLAPWVRGPAVTFWGDSSTHARVAAEIARTGLVHGWLDSYVGGFPFGHHYPQLGWLLMAAGIRLGLTPAEATHLVGWSATLAAPVCLYFLSVRFGARPRFAFVGATFLLWVSPYNSFVGGYETFFNTGLVSQSVGLPISIWLASTALPNSKRWEAPLAAILAMSSHPQVATATLTVLGIAALASGRRVAILGCFRVGLFALIAGAALYGQGIATLEIPFGWPPGLGWRQFGFLPSRVSYWVFDGDLLDRARAPVLTALTIAALAGLGVNLKNPVARGLGVAFVASIALAVSGRLLFDLGSLGRALLSFLQPLRLSALLPPLAALVLIALLELATPRLEAALHSLGRPRWARSVSPTLLVGVLFVALFALPARCDYAARAEAKLVSSQTSCGPYYATPKGYRRDVVESWLHELSRGELWYDVFAEVTPADCLVCCTNRHGLDVASAVAIASVGGVGGHVGTLTHAGKFLAPGRPGLARRAEALGIRYLLVAGDDTPIEGWQTRKERGRVRLLERSGGTDRVGLGCIRERYVGSDQALRARLHAELGTPSGADLLLDPERLVELAPGSGEVRTEKVEAGDCDPTQASVSVTSDTPGNIEATVTNRAPVDVVFRATAFPPWRVVEHGSELGPIEKVAPGYFAVRVAAGRHRLTATAGLMPGYPFIVVGAILFILGLGFVRGEQLAALLRRRTRHRKLRSQPR